MYMINTYIFINEITYNMYEFIYLHQIFTQPIKPFHPLSSCQEGGQLTLKWASWCSNTQKVTFINPTINLSICVYHKASNSNSELLPPPLIQFVYSVGCKYSSHQESIKNSLRSKLSQIEILEILKFFRIFLGGTVNSVN